MGMHVRSKCRVQAMVTPASNGEQGPATTIMAVCSEVFDE